MCGRTCYLNNIILCYNRTVYDHTVLKDVTQLSNTQKILQTASMQTE